MATPAQQGLCAAQCPSPAALGGPPLDATCGAGPFVLFMGLLDGFLRAQCDLADPCGRVNDRPGPLDEYDFVVVGGGSAGAAVAGRLSEEPSWRVLLLEAGGDEPPGAQVPSMVINYHGTDLDWQYETQPEERACLGYPGRRCSWVRGKVLGGCSVVNGMMYTRGHPRDYDEWRLPGWRFEDVLPFYKRSEDNREVARVGTHFHGVGGPLTVQRFPHRPPLADALLSAAREAGLGLSEDLNGESITGFSVAQTTSRDGSRLSSARAFLRPARDRPNLHVLLNATATRVVIDPRTRQVTGVEFLRDGRAAGRVRVSKEVVVSGGAVNSPQLLLLSGVGPADHLRSVGVPLVHDLPGVGQNLHNHVAFFVPFNMRRENDTFDLDWAAAMQYMLNRTGPMASTGLSQVTGIVNSPMADKAGDHPDLQFFFAGFLANCARTGEVQELRDAGSPAARRSVLVVPVVLHPRSRGRLELASPDPLRPPLIYANYLTADEDARTLVEGIKIALRLGNTRTLKDRYGFELDRTPAPGCEQVTFGTDAYWDCAIRSQTGPENHQAGSCKMGLDDDPMAVVNPELKVIGVSGLRVADASVMPSVISGNTNAPAIMIGERAADFIKKQWKRDVADRFGEESFQGSSSGYYPGGGDYHPGDYHSGASDSDYQANFGKYPGNNNNGNYQSTNGGDYFGNNGGTLSSSTGNNKATTPGNFYGSNASKGSANHNNKYNNGNNNNGNYNQANHNNSHYNSGSYNNGNYNSGSYNNGNYNNGNANAASNSPSSSRAGAGRSYEGYSYSKPTTPWNVQRAHDRTQAPATGGYASPKASRSLPLQPQPWWQRSYDGAAAGVGTAWGSMG